MNPETGQPNLVETPTPLDERDSALAWLAVDDGLVAGIHHALNNRSGALAAVAQVLQEAMGEDHPLRAALAAEAERLQETVRTLRWLPASRTGRPEPVDPAELLRDAVELYALHHAVRDTPLRIESDPDVLPVLVEPVRLGHVVLTLLVAAGDAARRSGQAVRAAWSGDAERVALRLETVPLDEEPAWLAGAEPEGPGAGVDAGAMRGWVEGMGGTLEAKEDEAGARFVLHLPTLPAVRRRERAAEGSATG